MLEGKIDLNDIEDRETKTRIRYLLQHEDLKDEYPLQYDKTLRRLYRRLNNGRKLFGLRKTNKRG